jgi:hypothetical protein
MAILTQRDKILALWLKKPHLYFHTNQLLIDFGERLKLARLRVDSPPNR